MLTGVVDGRYLRFSMYPDVFTVCLALAALTHPNGDDHESRQAVAQLGYRLVDYQLELFGESEATVAYFEPVPVLPTPTGDGQYRKRFCRKFSQ